MEKMKMQDAQLMQASGDTMTTGNDWSLVMGTTPATNGKNSQGTASQETKNTILAGPAGPQEWNHSHPQLYRDQQAHV